MRPGTSSGNTFGRSALVGILREYSTVINKHRNQLVISILLRSTIAPQLHQPSKFLWVREFNFELVYLLPRKVIKFDQTRQMSPTFSGCVDGVT